MGKFALIAAGIIVLILIMSIPVRIVQESKRSLWCKDHGYKSIRTGQQGPSLCFDPTTRLVYNPE
jgi:hypothetical protein